MRVAVYVPLIPDENTTPSLGPLYLISVLEKSGFEGRLFDARIDRFAFRELLAFDPDIVGVSAVTAGYLGGLRLATAIRRKFPGVPIVFGGPHPSIFPEEVVRQASVDYVLLGESETSFPELCRRLADRDISPASLHEVANLTFKTNDEVVLNNRAALLSSEDLENLPWPAFHRMNMDAYFAGTQAHGLFSRGRRILPLMSSRGCPCGCTFCCRVMGAKIRSRSVESVMSEVRFLTDTYGIDELYFEDDNFTIQRARALEILDRLAAFRPAIHLKFANGVRVDTIDVEILQAMGKARVYSLSFGIESGCSATLSKMKKNLNLEQVKENILLAKSMGFLVGANCIIGYPGETLHDIEESLSFFFNLPLDSMAIVNLVPFPGTEVRDMCEKEGYLTEEAENWDNYYFSISNPIPLIETPCLSKKELVAVIRKAYRRMYLRPQWLWRSVRHLSARQIFTGAAMMLGLRGRRENKKVKDQEKCASESRRGST